MLTVMAFFVVLFSFCIFMLSFFSFKISRMFNDSWDSEYDSADSDPDYSTSSSNPEELVDPYGFQELLPCGEKQKRYGRPCPRSGHRAVVNDKFLIVIGGYNPNSAAYYDEEENDMESSVLRDVWMFNLLTNRWSEVKCNSGFQESPNHLASHSAVLHDNYILVFGGSSYPFGLTSSNDLYLLQITSNQQNGESSAVWRLVNVDENSKPEKQYGHAMLLHDKKLYIIGGTSGHVFNMKVYELALENIAAEDHAQLKWKSLLKGPECMPRYRHEAFFLDGKLIVLGGAMSNQVCGLDRVDVFDFIRGYWSSEPTMPDPKHGYPAARRCHGLAQRFDNGDVYICGGTDSPASTTTDQLNVQSFNDIWILHPNLTWEKFPHKLPEPLYFHSLVITPNCSSMLVFGGVVKFGGRSNRIYRIRIKPPSLEELALSALVNHLSEVDFENVIENLKLLEVPKHCIDWAKGIW